MLKNYSLKAIVLAIHTSVWFVVIYFLSTLISNKYKANLQDVLTCMGLGFAAFGIFVFVPATFGGVLFKTVDIFSMNVITTETEAARNPKINKDYFHLTKKHKLLAFEYIVLGLILGGIINLLFSIFGF